jgi:enediyne biosynthesis thioesterase
MRHFAYRHVVALEETNAVGNVYFVEHLSWQGRCRELFLREHTPDLLPRLGKDLCLITLRCTCEFLAEVAPFDEVEVRMMLGEVVQNRLTLRFEHVRLGGAAGEELVARGEQQVASMTRRDGEMVPMPIPESLRAALRAYGLRE